MKRFALISIMALMVNACGNELSESEEEIGTEQQTLECCSGSWVYAPYATFSGGQWIVTAWYGEYHQNQTTLSYANGYLFRNGVQVASKLRSNQTEVYNSSLGYYIYQNHVDYAGYCNKGDQWQARFDFPQGYQYSGIYVCP